MHVSLIIHNQGSSKSQLISAVRKCVHLDISSIISKVGTTQPLFVKELFSNQEPEFPDNLLSLIQTLERLGVSFTVYEILYDEREVNIENNYLELTTDILHNIIKEWEKMSGY